MRLTRHLSLVGVVGVAVVAVVASIVLAACGGGNDAAPVSSTVASSDAAVPADEQAAVFTQAFAAATPLDGVPFDASTLAGSDAVVWFWAPWCTICRAEAPEVAEIAERFADRVQVIGVPGRGDLDAMRAFVDDTGTGSITHFADLDGDVWSAFGVYGQPAFAFIDDSGSVEIFIGGMGGDALTDRIDQLLAA